MAQIITINSSDDESIRKAISEGVTTPELLADWIPDTELVEECLVLRPDQWHADDGNAECVYDASDGVTSAEEAAKEYVDTGDWGDSCYRTAWVNVRAWRQGIDAKGEIEQVDVERHRIVIKAEEPPCVDDEGHDWQAPHKIVGGLKENPGVFGHGGGVVINEVCIRCGCGKTTDTWGQDMDTGEQGLRVIEYTPDKYDLATSEERE